MASPALIHQLDSIEAAAYRDMFNAAPAPLRATLGLETREIAGATLLMAPGLPSPMFNRVIGLGNTQPMTVSALDQIAASYQQAGIKTWWIHVSPGAHPDTLVSTLATRGFAPPPRAHWVKVIRQPTPPQAIDTTLEIRQVQPEEKLALGETLCAAFEMPPTLAPWFAALVGRQHWHAVGAFDQGRNIGGGLLFLEGSSAWLGAGGVRPEARRQHAHRALMALRIQLAIDAGCSVMTTETGEPVGDDPNPSLRNMISSGFEKVFSRANYAAPAA